MTPPESDLPRIYAFSSPGSHKPDEPTIGYIDGSEARNPPERYEALTCGCFAFLLAAMAAMGWMCWRWIQA